jgi:hypothetical protein
MTISSEDRKAGPFPGDGVTVDFDFEFKVFADTDVVVIQAVTATGAETEKTIVTDYTVTLNPNQELNPGGRVTMLTPPPTGQTITLTSEVPNLQGKSITSLGGFFPQVLNDALDRLTVLVQQVRRDVARSVKVNISSTTTPDQMLEDINSSVIAADASAVAAAGSAVAADASADAAAGSAVAAADDLATAQALLSAAKLGAGADIASAATLDLTAATGQVVRVTGAVATDTITMNQGVMFCIADAAWPLTYHATTNPVQGGASYTCEAGDVVVYMKDGSDVLHNWILPKDGQPIEVVAQANGGTGYGVATRQVAQIKESWSAAVAAGSTVIPWDDSIPQSSEGDQYFSVAITPANASSRLEIDVLLNVGHSGTAQITGALFLDSETDARAAGNVANVDGSYQPPQLSIKYSMTAGSTSAMTFKVRAGGNVAGTLNLNGSSNERRLGGVLYSGITVREYLP